MCQATGKISKNIARCLRKKSTEAEKILWQRLRNKQLEGFKFRRQQILGRYIVDFVNFERKLVIELDGSQHALEKEMDRKRDRWLRTEGFCVLRYWNNEVFENLEGVLEAIRERLLTPSPSPSHQGRGNIWKKSSLR
ncbi:MAG: endonuclease domain-containing protein [Deltaproteobacteria bacterium]|nr:endonuclease domain-containing protein [Deltaproteobacteria bacterium]